MDDTDQTLDSLSRLADQPPTDAPLSSVRLTATPSTPPLSGLTSPAAPSEHPPEEVIHHRTIDWRQYDTHLSPGAAFSSPPALEPVQLPTHPWPTLPEPAPPLPTRLTAPEMPQDELGPVGRLTGPPTSLNVPDVKPGTLKAITSAEDASIPHPPSSGRPIEPPGRISPDRPAPMVMDGLGEVVSLLKQVVTGLTHKPPQPESPSRPDNRWTSYWTPDELPNDNDWVAAAPSFHLR